MQTRIACAATGTPAICVMNGQNDLASRLCPASHAGMTARFPGVVMRVWLILLLMCCALSIPARAASDRSANPDEESLASLEQRAEQAPAKSQCFFYAQLVHEIVEYSARQYAAGNIEKASVALRHSQSLTRKIEMLLAADAKKVKEAQILLRRSEFRLHDVLQTGKCDDEALVHETLAQLSVAENDLMLRVFQK